MLDFANQIFFEYTSIRKESQRIRGISRGGSIPTALVTGGTGFVGSHTIELLLQRGFDVRCLVRRSRQGLGWIEGFPIKIIRVSYLDVDMLRDALQGAEYVFHIAGVTKAKDQRQYHNGNVLTTKNLLEAASGISTIKKFSYVSSLAAVGPSPDGTLLSEDAPAHPITSYGVSKLEAETVCELHSSRVPIVILRPPAVYGPRDQDLLEIFRWVKRGIKPVFGTNQKTLSLIYGPELARALVDATIAENTKGETYFVADPSVYRLTDVIDEVAGIFGRRKTTTVQFPAPILYTLAGISELVSALRSAPALLNVEKARDLLQASWVCSPKKLEEHIGFKNQVTLRDGLTRMIKWYEEFGWL